MYPTTYIKKIVSNTLQKSPQLFVLHLVALGN